MTTLLLLSLHQLRREEAWLQTSQTGLSDFLAAYYREVCPHLPTISGEGSANWHQVSYEWDAYCRQAVAEVPRWYRRLARHSHPDAAGPDARPRLFAEATEAYRRRDWQQLREFCTAAPLPKEWSDQLTEQALESLRRVRQLTHQLKATAEYRLWQRHRQAAAQGWNLAALVVARLQTELRPIG